MLDDFNILGYHGTFSQTAEKIVEEGFGYVHRDNLKQVLVLL
ncbi:hypothetical protein J2Z66_002202 [Paenibacillus eucommiae]|uniref:Uncharacterized protein n=1 Tax=Paenibacillus eucommiae TaxID=1355755 RepID=A0ABS4IUQ6_9BACL|nr:hypothetical protein [Paenibacillus eucommiae]